MKETNDPLVSLVIKVMNFIQKSSEGKNHMFSAASSTVHGPKAEVSVDFQSWGALARVVKKLAGEG